MPTLDDNMSDGSSAVAEIPAGIDSPRDGSDSADRRQAAIVTLGRRAIAPPDISLLMQDAAALLAETLDAQFSGVAQPSQDDPSLVMQLFSAGEETITQNISPEKHLSMVGFALSVAHPINVEDLASESRFNDAMLKRSGIRSGIVCPLLVADHSFGALGIFSAEERSFTKDDVQFAETIAHLITTAAARQQAERKLDERNDFTDAVLGTVDALVLVLDKDGKIKHFNQACQEVTGFSPAEVRDRAIWSAFLVPEEVALVRDGFEQLRSGKSPVEYETFLLTKHGVRRRIAWAYTVQNDSDGSIRSIIATGVDVTAQREAEQQLEKSQEQVTEAQATLDEIMERVDSKDLELLGISDSQNDDPAPGSYVGTEVPDELGADRRQLARRAYPYKQRIAAVVDDRLPEEDRFEEVDCRDISAGGFSYLADVEPNHTAIVVALGVPPSLTYLAADVLHARPTEHNGQPTFVVGCRYTGRINYPPHGGLPARVG
jgi:PAS domain S-box-containing protein